MAARHKNRNRGFTLIEMLIVISLVEGGFIQSSIGKHRLMEIAKSRSLVVAPKPSPCDAERAYAVRNLFRRVSTRFSDASRMKSAFEVLALCSCGLFGDAALYV